MAGETYWPVDVTLLAVAGAGPVPVGGPAGALVAVDAGVSTGIGVAVPSDVAPVGAGDAPVTSGWVVGVVGVVAVVGVGVGVTGAVAVGPGVTAQVDVDATGESGVTAG